MGGVGMTEDKKDIDLMSAIMAVLVLTWFILPRRKRKSHG
jgi:hypothetical protein